MKRIRRFLFGRSTAPYFLDGRLRFGIAIMLVILAGKTVLTAWSWMPR